MSTLASYSYNIYIKKNDLNQSNPIANLASNTLPDNPSRRLKRK
ncbi:putative RNA-directed DNA polymerase from transposon X-element [Aphis craccivora]|uniref:Putative RNA-directed DNA polymerase from transposon X-element n=1 Tax=Aphis craccivora TaxID=307492 RepID=A0A6G0Z645_APHCR|nr:putative RNA-directed DNA polymerase from transposon X-element [Aphis craccivora]